MDEEVAKPCAAMLGSASLSRKEKRSQLCRMALQAKDHIPADMRLRLLQYFMAGRSFFGGDTRHQHLSIALDASRVGLRNTVVGFLAAPDNTGMWLPPQVNQHGCPVVVSRNSGQFSFPGRAVWVHT